MYCEKKKKIKSFQKKIITVNVKLDWVKKILFIYIQILIMNDCRHILEVVRRIDLKEMHNSKIICQ